MPLLYIHHTTCISPQQSFEGVDIDELNLPVSNKLEVVEPSYQGIPSGVLRRMGKAIRMGVGAAMPLVKETKLDGIIIGTANGGMEDCIKFLNQIIDYKEGLLTPANFVGSTPNAIAAQIGFLTANKQYNITHVQSGLSFENALIDVAMLLEENPENEWLLGGVDEISTYNYNIDWLAGWYKNEDFDGNFYKAETPGSIAGEGAAMFIVNGKMEAALASVDAVHIFHSNDAATIVNELQQFLKTHLPAGETIDVFLTGENGDCRYTHYYDACEAIVGNDVTVARYKHICGEYPSSSAVALWIASQVLQQQQFPSHMVKKQGNNTGIRWILYYNHYKERQQSMMLISAIQKV